MHKNRVAFLVHPVFCMIENGKMQKCEGFPLTQGDGFVMIIILLIPKSARLSGFCTAGLQEVYDGIEKIGAKNGA